MFRSRYGRHKWRDTKNIIEDGYDKANKYMKDLNYKLKLLMLLTGSKNIEDLKKDTL